MRFQLAFLLIAAVACPTAVQTRTASAGADVAKQTDAAVQPAKPVNIRKKAAGAKRKAGSPPKAATPPEDKAAIEAETDLYKKELARRIEQANADQMYTERPQALLRSVVVVQFVLDGRGKLVSSRIRRSNHDRETEASALASLRGAAPFPKPPAKLLRAGRLELHETWLFNDDGRFQIRSTAQPQIGQ